MWGSTFADLAKKAQELQEQAAAAAKTFPAPGSGGLFNLDAMQQHIQLDESGTTDTKSAPLHEESIGRPVRAPVGLTMSLTASTSTLSPSRPEGVLKVPASPVTAAAVAASTYSSSVNKTSEALPTSPPISIASEGATEHDVSVAIGGADGGSGDPFGHWNENTELDKSDLKEPNDQQEAEAADGENGQTGEPVSTHPNETLPTNDDAVDLSIERGHIDTVDNKDEPTELAQTESSTMIVMDNLPSSTDTPLAAPAQELQYHIAEDEEKDTALMAPDAPQAERVGKETEPLNASATKKLVVLVSGLPMRREVEVRQDKAITILQSKHVDFEMVDGADPDLREFRDQLFQVSGLHGVYPQFFLVDLSDGAAAFWGDWERFEQVNDNGLLHVEFSGGTEQHLEDNVTATEVPVIEGSALIEHVVDQMRRLEENHQAELAELEQRHYQELQNARNSADHSGCEASKRELETSLLATLKEIEDKLVEASRVNEGYKLKIDMLNREVEGTKQLLVERDTMIEKGKKEHFTGLRAWEQKFMEAEDNATKAKQEANKLQAALDASHNELEASKHELSDLKARVKGVANELKQRRVECRESQLKIDELMETNEKLLSRVNDLEQQLSNHRKNNFETNEEVEQLKAQLVELTGSLEKERKAVDEERVKGEKALAEYKKKAQGSLAVVNSRIASAVQAKEEAELEARAARNTADAAMDKAVKAELASKEAIAEARATVSSMKAERDAAAARLEGMKQELKALEDQRSTMVCRLEEVSVERDGLSSSLTQTNQSLWIEKSKVTTLEMEIADLKRQMSILRENEARLREQLQRAEVAVADGTVRAPKPEKMVESASKPEDRKTIVILQEELMQSNQTISDLKAALKNYIELNESKEAQAQPVGGVREAENSGRSETDGNDSGPLFYAMEKQAELNTARNEINRLANLLSDAQSEKMEAYEVVETMRRRMEEAEARLKRFEKLSPAQSRNSDHVMDGRAVNGEALTQLGHSGAVNIEYLKNIMLSYLNAKTLAERKSLVPVIGAVLCLTQDEQRNALKNLEESMTLGSVSNTLSESIGANLSSWLISRK